jgi:hypothetical protein
VWNTIKDNNYKTALALNPTGRMGTPQEMANAVLFLASRVANFITGTNLVVDGALTRGVQFWPRARLGHAGFCQDAVDALVAVDHLRNPQIRRDRAERIGILRAEAACLPDQRDHVA